MKDLVIAAAQFENESGDKRKNLNHIHALTQKAARAALPLSHQGFRRRLIRIGGSSIRPWASSFRSMLLAAKLLICPVAVRQSHSWHNSFHLKKFSRFQTASDSTPQ